MRGLLSRAQKQWPLRVSLPKSWNNALGLVQSHIFNEWVIFFSCSLSKLLAPQNTKGRGREIIYLPACSAGWPADPERRLTGWTCQRLAARAGREIALLPLEKNRRALSTCEESTSVNHFIRFSSGESFLSSFKAIPWLKLNHLSTFSFGHRRGCGGNWGPSKASSPCPSSRQAAAPAARGGRGGILKMSSWDLVVSWQLLFGDELLLFWVCLLTCTWCGVQEMVKQNEPHSLLGNEWVYRVQISPSVMKNWSPGWPQQLPGFGLLLIVSWFHPAGAAPSPGT